MTVHACPPIGFYSAVEAAVQEAAMPSIYGATRYTLAALANDAKAAFKRANPGYAVPKGWERRVEATAHKLGIPILPA